MNTKKIVSISDADEQMRQLYETAFPEAEQIPWEELLRLTAEMPLDFTAYYDDDGAFVGFTIVYPHEPFTWFWYFAVRPELRGKGKGQAILTSLIEKYKDKRCILDMESPRQACDNMEQRKRRHAFYLRNGFCDTDVYRSFEGIEYTIMMLGDGKFSMNDYENIINNLHRFWSRRQNNASPLAIRNATKDEAPAIARLIMMAMTDECCLYFCGEGHGLDDFHEMMTELVEQENSQYSYRNTLVAMSDGNVAGIAVSYDGGKLHMLRQAFVDAAKLRLGKDHSGMDDETQAGELYLDSLAVHPDYRRKGIARSLLMATKDKANQMNLPCVGLLVDKGNPEGEALYRSVGFRNLNDSQWGGHAMRHLIL